MWTEFVLTQDTVLLFAAVNTAMDVSCAFHTASRPNTNINRMNLPKFFD